jgi:DNA-directed RNA polymerase subunit RPC12/RpoP
MEYQCDNCLEWFADSSYIWEAYHECPHCRAWGGLEEPDED